MHRMSLWGYVEEKEENNMMLAVHSSVGMLKLPLGQIAQHQVQVLWIQWWSYRDHLIIMCGKVV